MGSLVPGWKGHGGLPKDLVDYDDNDTEEELKKKGYFAQYEKHKSLRKSGYEDAPFTVESSELVGSPVRGRSLTGSETGQRLGSFSRYAQSLPSSGSLRRGSFEAAKDASRGASDKDQAYPWWDRVPSAIYNDKPDLLLEDYRKGGYVPQYSVTGQNMNYITKEPDGEKADTVTGT